MTASTAMVDCRLLRDFLVSPAPTRVLDVRTPGEFERPTDELP